eukprot:490176-Rhodomonas_salina.1
MRHGQGVKCEVRAWNARGLRTWTARVQNMKWAQSMDCRGLRAWTVQGLRTWTARVQNIDCKCSEHGLREFKTWTALVQNMDCEGAEHGLQTSRTGNGPRSYAPWASGASDTTTCEYCA